MICRTPFCSFGFLLCGALILFSCLPGCWESEKQGAQQEEFVPAKVQPRVERHCSLIRLNGEMGDMAAEDYQKREKDLVPPLIDRYRQLHTMKKKEQEKDLENAENAAPETVVQTENVVATAQNPSDITCMPNDVAEAIQKANIRNYSVFITKINKIYYAIRYFDYVGKNFDVDWVELERNKSFAQWRNACDECQLPLPADKTEGSAITMLWELNAEEIFYQE